MKTLLVTYRVHAEHAAENLALIRSVFDQLDRETPVGLHYRVFRSVDGYTFFHLAQFVNADGPNPLPDLQAFKQFQLGLRSRCSDMPQATELSQVECYEARG